MRHPEVQAYFREKYHRSVKARKKRNSRGNIIVPWRERESTTYMAECMYYGGGYKIADIARVLGVTIQCVSLHICKTRSLYA